MPCHAPHSRAWPHAAVAAHGSTASNGSGRSCACTSANGSQTAVEAVPPAQQPKNQHGDKQRQRKGGRPHFIFVVSSWRQNCTWMSTTYNCKPAHTNEEQPYRKHCSLFTSIGTHSKQCNVSELEILTRYHTSTTPGFICAYMYIKKRFVSYMPTFVYTCACRLISIQCIGLL